MNGCCPRKKQRKKKVKTNFGSLWSTASALVSSCEGVPEMSRAYSNTYRSFFFFFRNIKEKVLECHVPKLNVDKNSVSLNGKVVTVFVGCRERGTLLNGLGNDVHVFFCLGLMLILSGGVFARVVLVLFVCVCFNSQCAPFLLFWGDVPFGTASFWQSSSESVYSVVLWSNNFLPSSFPGCICFASYVVIN